LEAPKATRFSVDVSATWLNLLAEAEMYEAWAIAEDYRYISESRSKAFLEKFDLNL
jgi:hypothetical protein